MQRGSLVGVRQVPLPTKVPQVCCLALQCRLSMGEQTGLPNTATASALCGELMCQKRDGATTGKICTPISAGISKDWWKKISSCI